MNHAFPLPPISHIQNISATTRPCKLRFYSLTFPTGTNYNEAAKYLKKATEYSKKNEPAFEFLANAYFKLGQCDNAVDSINKAKRLEPLKESTNKLFNDIASKCNVGILYDGSCLDFLQRKDKGYD